MFLDSARVPPVYQALWADHPRQCETGGVRVSERRFGTSSVTVVEGYSDYQAVALTLSDADKPPRRVFLDITDDGGKMLVSEGGGRRDRILRRCPGPDLSWAAQARGACASGDFGLFFEAFVASGDVRHTSLARHINISRTGSPIRTVPRRAYVSPAIRFVDYHFAYEDGPDQFTPLKLDWAPLPDGGYIVHWVRAKFEDQGEGDTLGDLVRTFGPSGTLRFRHTQGCWSLDADTIDR